MTYALLPNLDGALISFLTGHTALSALHGGRVGTTLAGSLTQIRVAALGGTQPWPWEGTSEYQVECWGGTQLQAETLARSVVAAIYDLRGAVTSGWALTAEPTLRPLWLPDPDTARARYIVQVSITAYPA